MNNFTIHRETNVPDREELRLSTLKSFEARNVRIISAIEEIQKTAAWSSLKEIIFDSLSQSLEREIQEEAMKEAPNPLKLNRLTGELTWAKRFADLTGFANEKRSELLAIREQLNYGKTEH